jgi:hypothetical protein
VWQARISWLRAFELYESERQTDVGRAFVTPRAFEGLCALRSQDIFAIDQPLKVTEGTKADLP